MASCSKHHRELTDGEGKCSVPMWSMGCPAGFCDQPAYGKQTPGRYGHYEHGRWIEGYVPFLACSAHGGPKAKRGGE